MKTVIPPSGDFSLAAAASFGFGSRLPEQHSDGMRLAFAVDGGVGHAAVRLNQDDTGRILLEADVKGADPARVEKQVRRILSLDADEVAWRELGSTNEVVRRIQELLPGLRPVLFHSPWEGGLWTLISNRQPRMQARRILDALGREYGSVFPAGDSEIVAAPQPSALLELADWPGLAAIRADRIRVLAAAAAGGDLSADRLAKLDPAVAMAELKKLPGIGDFSAGLMLVRAAGVTDVLPEQEPTTMRIVGRLYGLGRDADASEFAHIAESWRPFRTWVMVLLRVAENRGLLSL